MDALSQAAAAPPAASMAMPTSEFGSFTPARLRASWSSYSKPEACNPFACSPVPYPRLTRSIGFGPGSAIVVDRRVPLRSDSHADSRSWENLGSQDVMGADGHQQPLGAAESLEPGSKWWVVRWGLGRLCWGAAALMLRVWLWHWGQPVGRRSAYLMAGCRQEGPSN